MVANFSNPSASSNRCSFVGKWVTSTKWEFLVWERGMPGHTFTQNGGKRPVKTTEGMSHVVVFCLGVSWLRNIDNIWLINMADSCQDRHIKSNCIHIHTRTHTHTHRGLPVLKIIYPETSKETEWIKCYWNSSSSEILWQLTDKKRTQREVHACLPSPWLFYEILQFILIYQH